jgi:hypothetical protein
MITPRLLQKILFCIALTFGSLTAAGQVQIRGTLYDRSVRFGMPGVSVLGTSGSGTMTDSSGRYSIKLPSGDSIYFSYLGKTTRKFPVKELPPDQPFDMSLPVSVDSLPTIVVRQNIYRLDSLENRNEYRKIFNYEPDYLANRSSGFGVGVSLDALFSGKKIRQMETLRRRLEQEERDKYINHRFTRGLVRRITGLQPPALDTFMVQYRPEYETLLGFETDYEYYEYLRDQGKFFTEIWRREHPIQPQKQSGK